MRDTPRALSTSVRAEPLTIEGEAIRLSEGPASTEDAELAAIATQRALHREKVTQDALRRGFTQEQIDAGLAEHERVAGVLRAKWGTGFLGVRLGLGTPGSELSHIRTAAHSMNMDRVNAERQIRYVDTEGPVYEYNGSGGIVIPEVTPELEPLEREAQTQVLMRAHMSEDKIASYFNARMKKRYEATADDKQVIREAQVIFGEELYTPATIRFLKAMVNDGFLKQSEYEQTMLALSTVPGPQWWRVDDVSSVEKIDTLIESVTHVQPVIDWMRGNAPAFTEWGTEKNTSYRIALIKSELKKHDRKIKMTREEVELENFGREILRVAEIVDTVNSEESDAGEALRRAYKEKKITVANLNQFIKSGKTKPRSVLAILDAFRKEKLEAEQRLRERNRLLDQFASRYFPVREMPAGLLGVTNEATRRRYSGIVMGLFETHGEAVVMERLGKFATYTRGFSQVFGVSEDASVTKRCWQLWKLAETSGGLSSTAEDTSLEAVVERNENLLVGQYLHRAYRNNKRNTEDLIHLAVSSSKAPTGARAAESVLRQLGAGRGRYVHLGRDVRISFESMLS